jgi:hypothetical protein
VSALVPSPAAASGAVNSHFLNGSEFWITELAYTTRRRRLSSITRAPCRKVMGVPGQDAL